MLIKISLQNQKVDFFLSFLLKVFPNYYINAIDRLFFIDFAKSFRGSFRKILVMKRSGTV